MTQSMAEERPEGGGFREEKRMLANAAPKIKNKGQDFHTNDANTAQVGLASTANDVPQF